jgi:glycosyltransferase involved in cell wall biosynthesis
MRLGLVGAFPFPYAQGSQVYLSAQRDALEAAGAECETFTYATLPGWLAPRSQRSGPRLKKPIANAALAAALVAAHRRRPLDALLAHNAEAAVIGILARKTTRVPVVYVAHTLLRFELSAYGPRPFEPALDRVGLAVDRFIARRADGIVALSEDARALLAAAARCEITVIPPGLTPAPDPDMEAAEALCARIGVSPRGFALYAGNLDSYQDLDLLDGAAARLCGDGIPVVVATHDARDGAARHPNLRVVQCASYAEIRSLQHTAGWLVLTRRRRGGFPIKLLNYMESGRPIVAFDGIAPGLVHGEHAWLLDPGAGPAEVAEALRTLARDPERSNRLSAAARAHLRSAHAWPTLADRTLAFLKSIVQDTRTTRTA